MPFPLPTPDRFLTRLRPPTPSPPPPPHWLLILPHILATILIAINLYTNMTSHQQILLIIAYTLSIIIFSLTISRVEKFISNFELTILYFICVPISTTILVSVIYNFFFTP